MGKAFKQEDTINLEISTSDLPKPSNDIEISLHQEPKLTPEHDIVCDKTDLELSTTKAHDEAELTEEALLQEMAQYFPTSFASTKQKGHTPRKGPAQPTNKFKTRDVCGSPTKYKLATTLPKAETIESLNNLPHHISDALISTIKLIYSHVAQRSGKAGETFFSHIGITAAYETATSKQIADRNHRIKAGETSNKIKKTIAILTEAHGKLTDSAQSALLEQWHQWLNVQYHLFSEIIQRFSHEDLTHLVAHAGYQTPSELLPPSPNKKEIVHSMHPKTPPKKASFPDANTPKSKTKETEESLNALQTLKNKKICRAIFKEVEEDKQQDDFIGPRLPDGNIDPGPDTFEARNKTTPPKKLKF